MLEKVVYLRYALAAMAVIGTGIWLAVSGDEIAEATGWGAGFIGGLFLAVSTSMPELVVTVAAVRLGAIDMAVADALGANMINIAKIVAIDLFCSEGPVLSLVSRDHLTTAVVAIAMTFIVILGLRFRQERKTFVVISWYGPLLIGLYIFGAYALFTSGMGLG